MDGRAFVLSLSMIAALSGACDTRILYNDEGESCRAPLHKSEASNVGLCVSSPAGSAHVMKELQASEW